MEDPLHEYQVFQEYFNRIRKKFLLGDYTEGTFRTPFENFIETLSNDIKLIQEPRRTRKIGAPDFRALRKGVKVGYIEAKDLGKNLDDEIETEQIKKYSESINNLILTNYSRFILIRNNQKILDLSLFSPSDLDTPRFVLSKDKIEEFKKLLDQFFSYKLTIKSAQELALELSKKAKLLKDLAKEQLEEDLLEVRNNHDPSSIYDFYEGIRELIRDINVEDCADAYAETITYGLFLSKIYCSGNLDRKNAASYIPRSIGIIKRIFLNISGDALPYNISWIIDEIIDILNVSDMPRIISQIDFRGKRDRDPFSFFYEDFLSSYDPKRRKHLGVFYTPRPIVSFIVNSIDEILKKDFSKLNGFAEDDVTVLDPAVGTGTFLWLVFIKTLTELKRRGLGGLIEKKIENHVLKDFYGLEILITPYIIAHLKLTLVLKKWFYELEENERVQIYLTNTLDPSESHSLLPFLREITEESKTANELKLRKPILVILGNPPYAGMSANKGEWITNKLKKGYDRTDDSRDHGYYRVNGKSLREKNLKWLQDDYVKFIRFAQWKIDSTDRGVLGFITNHSYLDSPTFRGMRQSLIGSFNRIYILNLHGNARRKERSPDGSRDENIFDIKPGVAIALFVKNDKLKNRKMFYADLYGKREHKYSWLDRNRLSTVPWREIEPKAPYYFFIPRDTALDGEYEKYWKITDIFPIYSVGIVTARDNLTIRWTPEETWKTVTRFAKMDSELARKRFNLGKDVRDWKVEFAQKDLVESGPSKERIVPILYRPFDIRYTYYTGKSRGFHCMPRPKIMRHMMQENLGLLVCRQQNKIGFYHVLVCNAIAEACVVSNKTREINYLFPLYIYPKNEKTREKKRPNVSQKLLKSLSEIYKVKVGSDEIFYYVYAVLFSNKYRTKYAELLNFDFPRIPFVEEYDKFRKLSEIGKDLVDLHLMRTKLVMNTKFDVQDSNVVEFAKYRDNKIYINNNQFFDGISEDIWNFYIGGYQVLYEWLKSRRKKELSTNEVEQFIQIIGIIEQTIDHMKKIDEFEIF